MNQLIYAPGEHLIAENQNAEFLTIQPGAQLKAPEGKYLCLTVNGCVHALEPGSYHGAVVITVAEPVVEAVYPSVRRKSEIPLEAAVSIKDGKLVEAQGVPAAV